MIQEKFNKLKPYLKGLKYADNYNIVETNLRLSWRVVESENIEFQKKKMDKNENFYYYMFYSEKLGFDEILDWLEKNVINYNLELEEKETLLRAKVEELKRVFEQKSIKELNNLKFTTELDMLKLNGKSEKILTKQKDGTSQKI